MSNPLVSFGKHEGRGVRWVAQHDPGYLLWMATLPAVRANPHLWRAVRSHLIAHLQHDEAHDHAAELA